MHCNDSARSSRQRSANLCPSPMRCPRRLIGCYASRSVIGAIDPLTAPVAGPSGSAAPTASEHTSNGNRLAVCLDVYTVACFRKRVRIGLSAKSASRAVTMSSVIATLKTGTQLCAC